MLLEHIHSYRPNHFTIQLKQKHIYLLHNKYLSHSTQMYKVVIIASVYILSCINFQSLTSNGGLSCTHPYLHAEWLPCALSTCKAVAVSWPFPEGKGRASCGWGTQGGALEGEPLPCLPSLGMPCHPLLGIPSPVRERV